MPSDYFQPTPTNNNDQRLLPNQQTKDHDVAQRRLSSSPDPRRRPATTNNPVGQQPRRRPTTSNQLPGATISTNDYYQPNTLTKLTSLSDLPTPSTYDNDQRPQPILQASVSDAATTPNQLQQPTTTTNNYHQPHGPTNPTPSDYVQPTPTNNTNCQGPPGQLRYHQTNGSTICATSCPTKQVR